MKTQIIWTMLSLAIAAQSIHIWKLSQEIKFIRACSIRHLELSDEHFDIVIAQAGRITKLEDITNEQKRQSGPTWS